MSPAVPDATARGSDGPVFDDQARSVFARAYPETAQVLTHRLRDHPLLGLEALAVLGESLPPRSLEYNLGDLPIGIDPDRVPRNGLGIGDTIRHIDSTRSWAVLKNIEQVPAYRALLMGLLDELRPRIEATTGELLRPEGFVFVSSPGAVTPFHFDPEHNILLQVRGEKTMTVFPQGDPRFAPPQCHEQYHAGGTRNLPWDDRFAPSGVPHRLTPGLAIFVPVMAPHFVKNGPEPSISLSITWRSEWSFAEADAHALNALMRRAGLQPALTQRYPSRNLGKSLAWRTLRKLRVVR